MNSSNANDVDVDEDEDDGDDGVCWDEAVVMERMPSVAKDEARLEVFVRQVKTSAV